MSHELEKNTNKLQIENLWLELQKGNQEQESDKLQVLMDTIPDILGILRPDRTVVRYNQAGYDFLNMNKEKVQGKKCFQLIGRTKPCKQCASLDALKSGMLSWYEKYFPEFGRYMHCQATPVFNNQGKIIYIIKQLRDVTERRKIQETPEENERKYRLLAENVADLIWTTDLNGYFTFVTPSIQKIHGYTQQEAHGLHFRNIFPAEELKIVNRAAQKTIEKDRDNTLDDRSVCLELRQIKKKGTIFWTEVLTTPLRIESGEMVGFQGTTRDISNRKNTEEALRESEERYRNLFHNAQVGLFRTRIQDGEVLECNQQFARMLGYKHREEIVRQIFIPEYYVDPGSREVLLKQLHKWKEINKFEARFYRRDGSIFNALYSASLYPDKGYIEGVLEDISQQKEAEERYRSLFDEAPIGICSVTVQGEYISLNSALARMYGYSSPREIMASVGNTFQLFVHPEDREMMLDWLERFDRVYNFECKVRGKDGKEFWTSRTMRAIRDIQGRFTHYESFVEDIQARKEAELLSERSRQQLINILEQIHAGVFVVNPDNKEIIFANKYLYNAMGKDVLGKNPYNVLLKEGQDCHFPLNNHEFDKIDDTLSRELLFTDNRWYLCTAKLASWFDGTLVVLVIAMDITKNKEAEQLKEDMERITRHDLKGPLNGIVGLPDLLLSTGKFNEKEIEMLQAIRDSGKKMQNLIDSSLSLYKLENKEYEIEYRYLDLVQVFRQIETEVANQLQSKNLCMEYYLGTRPLSNTDFVSLYGDETLIPFLFSNLIKNAVEASPSEHSISITVIPEEPFRVVIQNQGSVPKEIQNTFFDKYVSSGKDKGTGLGTYSALLATRAHQGNIKMQSSKEEGTIITVSLPQVHIERD